MGVSTLTQTDSPLLYGYAYNNSHDKKILCTLHCGFKHIYGHSEQALCNVHLECEHTHGHKEQFWETVIASVTPEKRTDLFFLSQLKDEIIDLKYLMH